MRFWGITKDIQLMVLAWRDSLADGVVGLAGGPA